MSFPKSFREVATDGNGKNAGADFAYDAPRNPERQSVSAAGTFMR